jgi:predicted GIY-YIG superfamily endonuclease
MGSPRKGPVSAGKTALYRFYAADGELLYVGITQQIETRWKTHQRDKIWWNDVARKEHVWIETRAEAEELERTAIQTEHPRYDRTRPGYGSQHGSITHKRPLDDPYQEGIVARTERAMRSDLESGAIPKWSLLPTNAVLAERYETSRAAIEHVLRRLYNDGLLASTGAQYINAPREGFPSVAARQNVPHYVLAAHHFGLEPFTAEDLMPYVPHGLDTVAQRLSGLCKKGLARCVARKPVGQYVLTKMPDPDPVRQEPATRQDVAQMEKWLADQIAADQESTADPRELGRLERDLAVMQACTTEAAGYVMHRSSEVLAEMAHFYADRPGYEDIWKPKRLGGPEKPSR